MISLFSSPAGCRPVHNSLSFLRMLCTFLVVLIHASSYTGLDGNIASPCTFSSGVYDAMRIVFAHGICLLAVPVFYVLSGYFFFSGFVSFDFALWRSKLVRRLRSLLLPFVLWGLISLVAHVAVGFVRADFVSPSHVVQWLEQMGWWRVFWDCGPAATGMPLNFPLWFVRDLMCVVLMTPLIFVALRFAPHTFLILLFLAGFHSWWPMGFIPGQPSVLFFSLGGYMAFRGHDVASLPRRVAWVCVPVSFVLLGLMAFTFGTHQQWHAHCRHLFVVIGSVGLIALAPCVAPHVARPRFPFPSFFVYALHTVFVISFVWRLLMLAWPSCSQIALTVKCLLAASITVAVCVVVFLLLRAVAPRLCRVLCGGREE